MATDTMYHARETDRLSGHGWHALRLYGHARTHPPSDTGTAHRHPQRGLPAQYTIERETASLSEGYRHNVPHTPSAQAAALPWYTPTIGARIPIGHRNGYSAPQPLPWYTDHRGTGTAHTAPQAAALCYASAYTYPQEHPQGHTDPHRAQAAALCYVCAYIYPQERLQTASAVTDSTRCGSMVMRYRSTHEHPQTPSAMATDTMYHASETDSLSRSQIARAAAIP